MNQRRPEWELAAVIPPPLGDLAKEIGERVG